MRSSLTLLAFSFVALGGLGLSACAEGAFSEGGAPEDREDLGRPDLGRPDMGDTEDAGPVDMGRPDAGPPDMGQPDMSFCPVGQATCCGDAIIQMNEICEPFLDIGDPGRCPTDPRADCNQSSGVRCIERRGTCLARCVPRSVLDPTQVCP